MLHMAKLRLPVSIPRGWKSSRELEEGLPYSSRLLDLIRETMLIDPNDRLVFEEVRLRAITHSQELERTSSEGISAVQSFEKSGNCWDWEGKTVLTAFEMIQQGNILRPNWFY